MVATGVAEAAAQTNPTTPDRHFKNATGVTTAAIDSRQGENEGSSGRVMLSNMLFFDRYKSPSSKN